MPGFDLEQFVDVVSEEFRCMGICYAVLDNPVQCKNGHLFCRACIQTWLHQKDSCPTCHVGMSPYSLQSNLLAKKMISQLKIKCPHRDAKSPEEPSPKKKARKGKTKKPAGCDWTGTIESKTHHLACDCAFEPIACREGDCTMSFTRAHLDAHRKSCPSRSVTCKGCSATMMFKRKKAHDEHKCPDSEIKCTLKCGVSFKRKDLKAHQETCVKVPIDCPQGCGQSVVRRSVATHCKKHCSFRKCKHCDGLVVQTELAAHWKRECPKLVNTCENKCGVQGFPKELSKHKDECPLAKVPCLYGDFGCDKTIVRKDMNAHIEANALEHNMILAKHVEKLSDTVRKLESEQKKTIFNIEWKISDFDNVKPKEITIDKTLVCSDRMMLGPVPGLRNSLMVTLSLKSTSEYGWYCGANLRFSVADSATYHLDLTGSTISFEINRLLSDGSTKNMTKEHNFGYTYVELNRGHSRESLVASQLIPLKQLSGAQTCTLKARLVIHKATISTSSKVEAPRSMRDESDADSGADSDGYY